MENALKFYFLAEQSGWNCSNYAFQYKQKLLSSTTYQIASINILSARKHLSAKAKMVCDTFDHLNKEPKTLKEVFILENTINYVALHSFPEYYLNPLTIDPNYSGDVTTIGDLIFDFQGKEMSLNEAIEEKTIPLEIKKEVINEQLEYYADDMNNLVRGSINILKKRAFSMDDKSQSVLHILEIIFFISMHFLELFILLYPFEPFREALYQLDYQKAMTYLWFLLPLSVFLYDLSFLSFHSYRCRISEPYNYARRFLKKNSSRVFESIKDKKEELYNYICGALNNQIKLQNDIKDFSMLSSSYVDFDKVLKVADLKQRKLYQVLRSFIFIFGTIASIMTVLTLIIYLIGMFFNATI